LRNEQALFSYKSVWFIKIDPSNQTFVGYLFFGTVKLIMPTFLLKRLEVLNTLGEEDSIKVHIYQVIEILQSNNRNDENATKKK
jgi:hypothetical protein